MMHNSETDIDHAHIDVELSYVSPYLLLIIKWLTEKNLHYHLRISFIHWLIKLYFFKDMYWVINHWIIHSFII